MKIYKAKIFLVKSRELPYYFSLLSKRMCQFSLGEELCSLLLTVVLLVSESSGYQAYDYLANIACYYFSLVYPRILLGCVVS